MIYILTMYAIGPNAKKLVRLADEKNKMADRSFTDFIFSLFFTEIFDKNNL